MLQDKTQVARRPREHSALRFPNGRKHRRGIGEESETWGCGAHCLEHCPSLGNGRRLHPAWALPDDVCRHLSLAIESHQREHVLRAWSKTKLRRIHKEEIF